MEPKLILSASHLAHRLGCDRRAVLRRLTKLEIMPGFITPAGEAFFDEAVLNLLEAAELEPQSAPQEAA